MAVALMIGIWIQYEIGYDKYHPEYDRIAQVYQNQTFESEIETWQGQALQLAPALREEYSNLFEHAVTSSYNNSYIFKVGDKVLNKRGIFIQDGGADILAIDMVEGSRDALKDYASILISESFAESFFDEVWVVAPMSQMSEIGHRVTTHETLRFEARGERRFAVNGTPADCTRVAMAHLMPEKPDWILSGINHGGNLGRHDFVISGTVAAVREAAFAGLRGAAFSHFFKRGNPLDWDEAARRAGQAFESFREESLEA